VKLARDLREFIELLNSHDVEYLLVGGHAVAYHGYPRYTGDIDFFVRPSRANARKLIALLEDFGFGGLGIELDDFTTPGRVIQLGHPPNRIDLVTGISGVTFDEAWAGRQHATLGEVPINIIGKNELLKNKAASGRAKDLADIEAIAGGDDID
jgi:hypothetical protein